MPETSAMPVRNRCGICVDADRVTRPVAESKAATAPRGSSGTAACRPDENVNSTTLVRCCEGGSDACGLEARVDKRVLRRDIMDQRRAGCERLVERHDRPLRGDLDRDLLGEIFGLSSGVGDHRSDRLTDISDALMREDRLRHRDIIGAVEARTDRLHVAKNSRGYHLHFRRCIHREDAAARDRAADEAQDAERPARGRPAYRPPPCSRTGSS